LSLTMRLWKIAIYGSTLTKGAVQVKDGEDLFSNGLQFPAAKLQYLRVYSFKGFVLNPRLDNTEVFCSLT